MRQVKELNPGTAVEALTPDFLGVLADVETVLDSGIEVFALEVKYPQGAEKQLIDACLGRQVPSGGLPMDVGVVVQNVGTAAAIIMAILTAVFFTILLVTGNTMAQAVRERIGELAVLKAIGFTNGGVLALVLAESCLLASIGGFFGIGLAWLMITGATWVGIRACGVDLSFGETLLTVFIDRLLDLALILGLGVVSVLSLLQRLEPFRGSGRRKWGGG